MPETDYHLLGKEKDFSWFVGTSGSALWTLAEIPIREYYLNPVACIEAYRKGRPLLGELFGRDIPLAPVCTPVIKYGHANAIGAKLNFPAGGEVCFMPLFDTPEEGIKHLQKPVDFATSGMTPFYLDFYRKMQAAFPDEQVHFGWQWEGSITTAWELLGESFMYDLFDKPDIIRRFLQSATASIVEFCRFFCEVENRETIDAEPDHGRICDDIAAMLPPRMWRDFVLPYWDMFFRGPVPVRSVHCEGMKQQHLEYLEQISICDYDPGISPELNPKIISAGTPVPFGWRLGGYQYSSMNCRDVEDFVYQAVTDGASYVFSYVEAVMCEETTAEKVRAFVAAAKKVKQLLDDGISRDQIGQLVSCSGRDKFWDHWQQ